MNRKSKADSKTATDPKPRKQPKGIKQSVTQDIHRSEIALNPYNPKRHTDRQVKQQVANIKANGYLGGIVWNKTSGNLVDGHRRVQALDIIHKYDGTAGTDYLLKVEVVEFDHKTELEQLTYMAIGNSRADYNLVAQYADQIDTAAVGLSEEDYAQLQSLVVTASDIAPMQDFTADLITSPAQPPAAETAMTATPAYDLGKTEQTFDEIAAQRAETPHASKEEIQAKKERNLDVTTQRNADRKCYIMLDFDSVEDLQTFCEATGVMLHGENMLLNGMEFLDKLGL